MQFVNLTPHRINVFDQSEEEVISIEPSGQVARVETHQKEVGTLDGVPIFEQKVGEVKGLPEPEEEVIYITSSFVEGEVSREDVYSPGNLLRDDNGRPVGAIGLKQT